MANRTSFVEVADGDQLSQGYFNEIGEFYVEHTDTGGPYTHNAATTNLERTYTFSGLSTNYELRALEFDTLALSDSSANSNDYSIMSVEVSDGTNVWSPVANNVANIPSGVANSPRTTAPFYWDVTSAGSPSQFMSTQSSTSVDHVSVPVPMNMITGSTSYTVKIYLFATQTSANTATLAAGFTVRLVFRKRAPRNLGTSTAEA